MGEIIRRWAKCFYNHPVCGEIDYIMANPKAGPDSKVVDRYASDRLRSMIQAKINENAKCEEGSKSFEPVGYGWAFSHLGDKYEESTGGTINQIMGKLTNMDVVMNKELDISLGNPEGISGRLETKRKGLSEVGISLTNKEMWGYSKYCDIVENDPLFFQDIATSADYGIGEQYEQCRER